MPYEAVIFEKENAIATLTLNRPEVYNALNSQLVKEADAALDKIARDQSIRVAIITGAGKGFCSGLDTSELAAMAGVSITESAMQVLISQKPDLISFFLKLRNIDKPIIAAVNGLAVGGGFCIAMGCDLRVVSENARFAMMHVKRGAVPDVGGSYFLPRYVGLTKAMELALTGDFIDAQEALRVGLVNKVVPPQELMAATKELATRIANNPPLAVSFTKRVLYKGGVEPDLAAHMDFEFAVQNLLFASEDFKEGVRAFIEKRPPQFKGR